MKCKLTYNNVDFSLIFLKVTISFIGKLRRVIFGYYNGKWKYVFIRCRTRPSFHWKNTQIILSIQMEIILKKMKERFLFIRL